MTTKEAINVERNRYSDIRLFTDMTQKHKIQLFEEKDLPYAPLGPEDVWSEK